MGAPVPPPATDPEAAADPEIPPGVMETGVRGKPAPAESLPRLLFSNVTDMNATLPDEPLSQATTRRISSHEFGSALPAARGKGGVGELKSNATVPGVGVTPPPAPPSPQGRSNSQRNATAPMPLPLPAPVPPKGAADAFRTEVGMPLPPVLDVPRGNDVPIPRAPASDPFVADAITAPAPSSGTEPMGIVPPQAAPPGARVPEAARPGGRVPETALNAASASPDLDNLVRNIGLQDASAQTPVVYAAESRGRDGATHVAVAQPAHGHVTRPLEPLVVVEVSTDPTSRDITSIVEPQPAQVWPTPAPPRPSKGATILLVCIFGACLIVAVGIGGALLARYHGPTPPKASLSSPTPPGAGLPSQGASAVPAITAPAVATVTAAAPSVPPPPESANAASEPPAQAPSHHSTTHSSGRPHPAPAHSNATHAEELERTID